MDISKYLTVEQKVKLLEASRNKNDAMSKIMDTMRSERARATEILDKAKRESDEILAKAKLESDRVLSEGRGEANKILMEAYKKRTEDSIKVQAEYDEVEKSIEKEIKAARAKYTADLDPVEALLANLLGLLLGKLYEDNKDEEVETSETNEKIEDTECYTDKFSGMTDDDLVAYINENLGKLSDDAKRYYNLVNARVLRVRSSHNCSVCGEIIPEQSLALVAFTYKSGDGKPFSYFWLNEYSLELVDRCLLAKEDDEEIKLCLYKEWYDLRCAAVLVDKALNMTSKLN